MAELEQPIIIKKITIEEGGAHGGAWKVAYADFVTAMMAFFLLLWLVSTTSEDVKEALAEYFAPTIGIKGEKGIGFEGGQTLTEDGNLQDRRTPVAIVLGRQHQGPVPENPEKQALIDGEEESKLFEKAEESIKKAFEADPNLRDLSDNIIVEQSPEGLKIEILDSDKKSMFNPGGAVVSEHGSKILDGMVNIIRKMPNFISITGHTDAQPFGKRADYTNWELSTARANSARRYLLTKSMKDERVGKVVGRADRELLVPDVPDSPRNRRITIILLRGSHMIIPLEHQSAPRSLLSVPRPKGDIKEDLKEDVIREQKSDNVSEVNEADQTVTEPSEDQ